MTDTATYYYAVDPTGSVIGLAEYDGTASVVNHYRYDVWGMPQGTETEGVENPIRFKSRWWDADTKLVDFRSRWYDPEIGRFISEDPIGLAGGINVFTFAGNNPVQGWDPFGLDPDDCIVGWWSYTSDGADIVGGIGSDIPIGSFPVRDDCPSNEVPLPIGGYVDYATSGEPGPAPKPAPKARPGTASPSTASASPSPSGTGPTEQCDAARIHLVLQIGLDAASLAGFGLALRPLVVSGGRAGIGYLLGRTSARAFLGETLAGAGHAASTLPSRATARAYTTGAHSGARAMSLGTFPTLSSFLNFIPGVATLNAVNTVRTYC